MNEKKTSNIRIKMKKTYDDDHINTKPNQRKIGI